jgi:hypothetical protein
MNITCIHLRVNGPHIYMYSRKRIYKELLEKYNNKNANTYLIPTCRTDKKDPMDLTKPTQLIINHNVAGFWRAQGENPMCKVCVQAL